ncbi:MAG: protein kinase [Anaerolineaceae bacterium]
MAIEQSSSTILGNRYRLIHQVGKGGMALVYQAYDQMLERPVAIKLLREDFLADEGFRDRFRQEARSAANLTHPNIVTIYDFGFDNNSLFIVMEFVHGTDLKTKIRQKRIFTVEEGIPLILQACAALGYAHRAGIVHCDVKPHNMLVTPDNRLKITDFGIARALATIDPQEKQEVVWGSPQYLSPEQAQGSAPSPASDVYSLGVVIYEMFTGRLPFEAENSEELAALRLTNDPVPPRTINPQIPETLEKIILKVLSKEPSQRFRTADQMGRVLLSFGQQPDNYFLVPPPIEQNPTAPTKITIPTPPPQNPSSFEDKIPSPTVVDWKTIGLELACILFVGGLIPFGLFVWFSIKPLLH